MAARKSIVAGNHSDAAKTKQVSSTSIDSVPCKRASTRMVQNVRLIWFANNINENNEVCQHTITQLRRVINAVNTFTDVDQCIDFVTDIYDKKIIIIISSLLCQNIVPLIHDIDQLHAILIFCDDKTRHEKWAKKWPKIKGAFVQITTICEALEDAAQQFEQNAISMSFINTNVDVSKNLDQLDPLFMYTQILKEILLTIEFEEKHINEFIDYSRDVFGENESDLVDINQLNTKYHSKTVIWWYTCEYFLYSTLNHALRLMDVDIIIKMGCFICDLHHYIQQLHNEQFGSCHSGESFTVYRGQGMSKADFAQMMKTKGGLMSFNNFLSTSKARDVSRAFAESNQTNPDLIGILFVMTIDPSKSTTPFASIRDVSCFQVEDEVLFSMHTVFRICEIQQMSENHNLFQVDLALTSDNDEDFRALTERMREEIFPNSSGWYRLGQFLFEIGRPDKGQQLYEVMLDQTTNESERGSIYHQIGSAKVRQGKYEEAITFYQKAVDNYQKTLSPNDPELATFYDSIGAVYNIVGDYKKALSYYEKALEIDRKALSPKHLQSGGIYNNIGIAYRNMGEPLKALKYYEKALEIDQKGLPANHPNLAASYNNIGIVYRNMHEYSKALLYYKKSLEIFQKSLPPYHFKLAVPYSELGNLYFDQCEYSKALSFYEKELEIDRKNFSSDHPNLASPYNNIGNVYCRMGHYEKALSNYEKSLAIRQQSLPPNYPKIAMSYYNIGNVYDMTHQYLKALPFYERAVDIGRRVLPSTHRNMQIYIAKLNQLKKKL